MPEVRLERRHIISPPAPTHRAAPQGAFPHGRIAHRHFRHGALAAPWFTAGRFAASARGRAMRPFRHPLRQSDFRKAMSSGCRCQDRRGASGIAHSLRALAFISRSTSA